ncbi:hypothetical protein C4544_06605 [candidate division WS5 bacterium]|uniref:DUF357 domain-containing protein n=1 Tax=candidate division WS5 bacterium TaxID=2093353 RepID=A0A419DA54_9BACT|nr:MAG: hypothetical protein C4544_06605 [candidate division WS5 bacterium]
MNKKAQITELIDSYISNLEKRGAKEFSGYTEIRTEEERMGYLLWFCKETKKFAEKGDLEKAGRWLGFIQGTLWALNIYSIDEMRDHNRPIFK